MYSGRGIQEASESNYVTFMELHRCLLLCSEPLSIVCLHNFHCFFNITFKKVKKKKVKILTTQIFTFKWQSHGCAMHVRVEGRLPKAGEGAAFGK